MAAIEALPTPGRAAQVPSARVPRPSTGSWAGSVLLSAVAVAALTALVPPAVGAVAAGRMLPAEEPRPSVALEGTLPVGGAPGAPVRSALVVRNTGTVAVVWRVRTEADGPSAPTVLVRAGIRSGPACAASSRTPVLRPESWSAPLAPGATATLCVTVTAHDRAATAGATTLRVDAVAR